VLEFCGAAVGRGEEVRGWRLEAKFQMSNDKVQNPNGKGERLRFRRKSRLEV